MKSSASFTKAIHEPSSYGWVIVVIAALAMVATLPGRTHGLGMITERLLSDPGSESTDYPSAKSTSGARSWEDCSACHVAG